MRHLHDVLSLAWYTTPYHFMVAAWLLWAISWFIAALWSRQAASSASLAQEALYRLLTAFGVFFLFGILDLEAPLLTWSVPTILGWMLFAVALGGFAWCWWARLHLGALWSSNVQRKEGHRIVDTGPYALTRHPIYTGLLTSVLVTGVARGRVEALLGAFLVILGTVLKARLEERFLSQTLGADYAAYRTRVPMLVPFVGR